MKFSDPGTNGFVTITVPEVENSEVGFCKCQPRLARPPRIYFHSSRLQISYQKIHFVHIFIFYIGNIIARIIPEVAQELLYLNLCVR